MKNKSEIIFLDIDDTIADLAGAMRAFLIDYEHYIHCAEQLTTENYINLIKGISDEEFCFLLENSNVLSSLELLPNTENFLKYCYDNYKLFFITARKWHSHGEELTAKWLGDKNINYDGLIVTDLKEMKSDHISKFKNVKLFIDDKINQYKDAKEKGIKSLLRTTPSNILATCDELDRINDLDTLIPF
jgi:uncharacterized HAD superfamily protein